MAQEEEKLQRQVTLTWLGEYYHRVEALPSLQECLKNIGLEVEEVEQEPMTDNEMLEMVKRLNAQFGGAVVEGEETKE